MTATPIPRTLALTLYGDLDVSVIDELPPGRKPIVTKHVTADRIEQVWSFLKKQIDAGPPGLRGLPGDRGIRNAGHEGRARRCTSTSRSEVFPQLWRRAAARPPARRREGSRDGALQARRDPDSGLDHGDRGRRGRAERHRDGDRAGRALRPGAAAPASRARGPRRGAELLHPGHREDERHRARAHPHAGGIDRRLLHRRNGPEAARAGRVLRHQAIRAALAAGGQHSARQGDSGSWRAARRWTSSPRRRRRRSCGARWPTSATTGSAATDW